MAGITTDDDAPLPLFELRDRVSENTYKWLQDADAKEAERKAQLEQERDNTINLFEQPDDDEDASFRRVQKWSSSSEKVDGIGGVNNGVDINHIVVLEDDAVTVKYVLSDAAGGHGEDIWAASRHVANLFASKETCCDLLSPLVKSDDEYGEKNPLVGRTFLELGAGGGIPSWTAILLGARVVVCTDQSIPNRIRCMAESAERNWRETKKATPTGYRDGDERKVRVCPYDWGSPIDQVTQVGKEQKFDLVVAADCIYMPEFHVQLLDSIKMLMAERGMALLPFALHGNTSDGNVWGIVPLAKQKGFQVEILESQQLMPQSSNMESKRGLVHMLRLTLCG